MKIGIFGDSFASVKYVENTTPTWVDILSTKYDVTNHALPGSNLYYSIKLIKDNHLKYDKIILVVTEPGRIKISKWLLSKNDDGEQFVYGIKDHKITNKNNFNTSKKLAYEAAYQYFLYLKDFDYDNYIHSLMLDDVKSCIAKNNFIIIPAFNNSLHNGNHSSMCQIFEKENTHWNIDNETINRNYYDFRNCHMTAENNEIFATKAEEWIAGKPVHINLDDFVTTTNKDFYLKQK
jgi:hypothetical protein